MEVIDKDKDKIDQPGQNEPGLVPEKRRFILTGLVLLGFGASLIADRMGYVVPEWLISWETILIAVGIFIGEKHHFRNLSFLIPIAIGVIFLVNDFYPDLTVRHYVGPGVLILIGLILILRPRKVWNWKERPHGRHHHKRSHRYYEYEYGYDTTVKSGEDYMDTVSIFGSTKKNIMSKNFKGGEATSFFGGTEINLMQADITGEIILDLTQVFGGCKLIIPAHWEVKSEVVNIFGGMEDKRPVQNVTTDHTKVVVIRGTSIFGGLEVRSY